MKKGARTLLSTDSSLEWESGAVAPAWLNVAARGSRVSRLHAQAYLCVTLGSFLNPPCLSHTLGIQVAFTSGGIMRVK